MAAFVASVLAFAPAAWLGEMLHVSGDAATSFLVRRYGASATAALFVVCLSVGRGAQGERAAVLGLGTWFGGQGLAAIHGVATGAVGGFAWLAIIADPALAAWFVVLTKRHSRVNPRERTA
jgi:hypothetical protein